MISERGRVKSFKARVALQLLQDRFCDCETSLSSISKEVGITPTHLSRMLSLHTGTGFRFHLRSIRLKHAVTLLDDPKLSIKQIASRIGYRHASCFDRDFKKEFGLTPKNFRNRFAAQPKYKRLRKSETHQSPPSEFCSH